ncbi:hypothetical protein QJQ45_022642 [Haematococcus lacustris]|nr:hypothetical protein QJQ45_022642 [Haematococcus lacustris]
MGIATSGGAGPWAGGGPSSVLAARPSAATLPGYGISQQQQQQQRGVGEEVGEASGAEGVGGNDVVLLPGGSPVALAAGQGEGTQGGWGVMAEECTTSVQAQGCPVPCPASPHTAATACCSEQGTAQGLGPPQGVLGMAWQSHEEDEVQPASSALGWEVWGECDPGKARCDPQCDPDASVGRPVSSTRAQLRVQSGFGEEVGEGGNNCMFGEEEEGQGELGEGEVVQQQWGRHGLQGSAAKVHECKQRGGAVGQAGGRQLAPGRCVRRVAAGPQPEGHSPGGAWYSGPQLLGLHSKDQRQAVLGNALAMAVAAPELTLQQLPPGFPAPPCHPRTATHALTAPAAEAGGAESEMGQVDGDPAAVYTHMGQGMQPPPHGSYDRMGGQHWHGAATATVTPRQAPAPSSLPAALQLGPLQPRGPSPDLKVHRGRPGTESWLAGSSSAGAGPAMPASPSVAQAVGDEQGSPKALGDEQGSPKAQEQGGLAPSMATASSEPQRDGRHPVGPAVATFSLAGESRRQQQQWQQQQPEGHVSRLAGVGGDATGASSHCQLLAALPLAPACGPVVLQDPTGLMQHSSHDPGPAALQLQQQRGRDYRSAASWHQAGQPSRHPTAVRCSATAHTRDGDDGGGGGGGGVVLQASPPRSPSPAAAPSTSVGGCGRTAAPASTADTTNHSINNNHLGHTQQHHQYDAAHNHSSLGQHAGGAPGAAVQPTGSATASDASWGLWGNSVQARQEWRQLLAAGAGAAPGLLTPPRANPAKEQQRATAEIITSSPRKRRAGVRDRTPPTKQAGKLDAMPDIDVQPSNEALGVVAGWLGMSAKEAQQEAERAAPEQEASTSTRRTPFLGLGAKYLPHHKAVGFAAALDTRLLQRLEAGQKRRQQRERQEAEDSGRGRGPTANTQHAQQRKRGDGLQASDEDGSEGEERSKSMSFAGAQGKAGGGRTAAGASKPFAAAAQGPGQVKQPGDAQQQGQQELRQPRQQGHKQQQQQRGQEEQQQHGKKRVKMEKQGKGRHRPSNGALGATQVEGAVSVCAPANSNAKRKKHKLSGS